MTVMQVFVFIYFFVSYFLLICIVFTVNQMLTTMINGERLCVLNYCELHCILDPYHRARSGQKLRMEDKKKHSNSQRSTN